MPLNAFVLMTEDAGTQSLITSHIALNTKTAFEEMMRSKAQYLEYINQFAQIIKTVSFVTSTIKNVYDVGKTLATTDPKVWLDSALEGIEEGLPVLGEIRRDVEDIVGKGKALSQGHYFDYVSSWDNKTLNFYDKLATNYEKHAMFPELYPKTSEARGWKKQTNAVIVKKAWTESGMAYEMDDDMVRKRLFGQYYNEYMKQAQDNDNLEAVGIAKNLQASYLINEGIDHLRKNSDMEVIEKMDGKAKIESYKEKQAELMKKLEQQDNKISSGGK